MTEKYTQHAAASIEPAIDLYNSDDFFAAVNGEIAPARAGDTISLATMSLEPSEPAVEAHLKYLGGAALSDASVTFAVDDYTFMRPQAAGPWVLPLPHKRQERQQRAEALEALRLAGANVGIINRPKLPVSAVYAGRSHIKFHAINDRVYIESLNLEDTDREEIIAGFNHAETADWLHKLAGDMVACGNAYEALGGVDQIRYIDDRSQLLVDAGKRGRSLILDNALALIDDAEDWIVFSSQFLPTGITAERLLAAHRRGVELFIPYNQPSQLDGSVVHQAVLAFQRRRYPEEFFRMPVPLTLPRCHAKILATEKSLMAGSHNLMPFGIRVGTAEMVVVRHDPSLALRASNLLLNALQLEQLDL